MTAAALIALVTALVIRRLRPYAFGISERIFLLAVYVFYLDTAAGLLLAQPPHLTSLVAAAGTSCTALPQAPSTIGACRPKTARALGCGRGSEPRSGR